MLKLYFVCCVLIMELGVSFSCVIFLVFVVICVLLIN